MKESQKVARTGAKMPVSTEDGKEKQRVDCAETSRKGEACALRTAHMRPKCGQKWTAKAWGGQKTHLHAAQAKEERKGCCADINFGIFSSTRAGITM